MTKSLAQGFPLRRYFGRSTRETKTSTTRRHRASHVVELSTDALRLGRLAAMAQAYIRNAVLTAIGACSGVLISQDALADGMRCGSKLISNGDAAYLVRSKCGAPQNVEQRTEYETVRRRVVVPCRTAVAGGVCIEEQEYTVTHQVETWTYDFGTSRLVHYATFVDGSLRVVQTGGYGTREDVE